MKLILPIQTLHYICCRMCLCLAVLSSGHTSSTGRGMNPAGSTLQRGCFALSWLRRRSSQSCVRDAGLVAWETGTLIHLMWLGKAVQPSSFILPWAVLNQLQTGHCSFVCLCSLSGMHVFRALQSQLAFSAGKIPVTSRDSNADLFCLCLCFSPRAPA